MIDQFKTVAKSQEVKVQQPIVPVPVTVNDRAATREAIIRMVGSLGSQFVERSSWRALKGKSSMASDWDYTMIALHHAGRSYSCGNGAEQMRETQKEQLGRFDDVSYHYGIDCQGVVYEGRDIRLKGENVRKFNSGVIGIVLLNNTSTVEEGDDIISHVRQGLEGIGFSTTSRILAEQITSLLNLIDALKSVFVISRFGGHREFPNQAAEGKICPGNIGMELVRNIRIKTELLAPPTL
jgi:hypothetical protein